MRRSTTLLGAVLALAVWADPGLAQTCTNDQVSAVIDQTGARLRKIATETQPQIRARVRELAAQKGWGGSELETKEAELLQDDETSSLDEKAGELLMKLDEIGDESRSHGSPCERLEQARLAAAQLIETTSAKASHISARLDSEIKGKAAAAPANPAPASPATTPGRMAANDGTAGTPGGSNRADTKPSAKQQTRSAPVAQAPQLPAVTKPMDFQKSPAPAVGGWSSETFKEANAAPAIVPPPALPADPGSLEFTPEDIKAAGSGFFGSISAGLASVLDHAFTQFGRPNGYILGNEGGGAFLAGLRYGDGTLVTKTHGESKVYWQGPSVGYDFGLAGSRVMFLVYSIKDPDELYSRFVGLEGSAYLVGGVGMTVLKKGNLLLAPIRTGLGLRVGANIGYLKFTPQPSVNPF